MRNRNWFWGLFFVVGGILFFAQTLGWTFGLTLWQLFVIILMASIILKSIANLEFFGLLMPLPFIYMVTRNYFPAPYDSINSFALMVTAAFLSIGLSILFKRRRHISFGHMFGKSNNFKRDKIERTSKEQLSGDEVYSSVSFGDSVKYVYSDGLRKAEFDCTFGSMKVYFDEAIIADGTADIYVDCSFGEMSLFFPREWKIINDVSYSFGSVDDHSSINPGDGPVVHIRGDVSFGEISILRI